MAVFGAGCNSPPAVMPSDPDPTGGKAREPGTFAVPGRSGAIPEPTVTGRSDPLGSPDGRRFRVFGAGISSMNVP